MRVHVSGRMLVRDFTTMQVLMVCTGNICRSPMAAAMARHLLAARGCAEVRVVSAGTSARAGARATANAVAVLGAQGLDLSAHRAVALDAALVREADLVVAMTSEHVAEILDLAPSAASRVFTLKELAAMEVPPVGGRASPGQRLAALLRAPRHPLGAAMDVDDPIGAARVFYEGCAREISTAVARVVEMLCGPADTQRGEV